MNTRDHLARASAFGSSDLLLPLESRTMLSGGLLPLPPAPGSAYEVAAADLDNDADIDVMTTYRTPSGVGMNILRNDGAGTLSLWQTFAVPSPGGIPLNVESADFDNDGDLDVVALGFRLYRNTGGGVLAHAEALTVEQINGQYFLADDNGDGLPDIFVHGAGTRVITVHRNVGGSAVQLGAPIHTSTSADTVLDVVDMNGDSHPDVVVSSSARVLVLRADGAGSYDPDEPYQAQSFPSTNVRAVGDVNGDSRPDLVWGFGGLRMALNQGDGTFGQASVSSADSWTHAIGLADFNNDGLQDVFGFTGAGVDPTVAYAIAPGVFSGQLRKVTIQDTDRFFVADLNADACADALLVRATDFENGQLTVYRSVPGPEITSFTAPQQPVLPGRFASFNLTTQAGAGGGVASVGVYFDSNADGVFDPISDSLLAQASETAPGSNMWAASWLAHDSIVAGPGLVFAVPTDAAGLIGDAVSAAVTFWTRVSYPEGWRNDVTINEYVPIVNHNPFPVEYRLVAHYETGERDQVIAEGIIPAFTRGGGTISERANPAGALVRLNEGYALELQSSAFLGATLSHYDSFTGAAGVSAAVGEAFSSAASDAWYFADVSTANAEFLVLFNPIDLPVDLVITIYSDDDNSFITVQRSLDALRRGGLALGNLPLLPNAPYAIMVAGVGGAQVIAALSSYSLTDGSGYTATGWTPPTSGVTTFPAVEFRDSVQNRLTLFNFSQADSETANVHITYTGAGEPIQRSFVLSPLERRVVNLDEMRPEGADGAVVRLGAPTIRGFVESVDPTRGDSVAAAPASHAFTGWAFADGFLDRNTAGTVGFETLTLFNPTASAVNAQVRFLFTDGTFAERTVAIDAMGALRLRLDQEQDILNHAQLTFYSIMVDAGAPIVASMIHWDLFQGGGWATLGTPTGTRGGTSS